jgi:hypothetical protein
MTPARAARASARDPALARPRPPETEAEAETVGRQGAGSGRGSRITTAVSVGRKVA